MSLCTLSLRAMSLCIMTLCHVFVSGCAFLRQKMYMKCGASNAVIVYILSHSCHIWLKLGTRLGTRWVSFNEIQNLVYS